MNRQILQQLDVRYEYPVAFTRRAFDGNNPCLAGILAKCLGAHPAPSLAVYIDQAVAEHHSGIALRIESFVKNNFPQVRIVFIRTLAGGERLKSSPRIVDQLVDELAVARMDRQSVVLAVGGGALLDTVGFAASLVHRGLKVVRMPTTVLSQNDGGVGVKTAVNHAAGKNFIGTFAPPAAVVNDLDFLRTLPDEGWRAGISEAFKVALIKDAAFFSWLADAAPRLRARDEAAMEQLVFRCAELHLQHIREGGDPFESGTARPLDFGHWLAHELELMSGYTLSHGAAVAIGISVDSLYASQMGLMRAADVDELLKGLSMSGFDLWHEALDQMSSSGIPAVMAGLEKFREHLGGKLCITLPSGIGASTNLGEIDPARMAAAIQCLRGRIAAMGH